MYWRRFSISSIPLSDPKEFDVWLRDRWTEKDALLEQFAQTGRFPPSYSDEKPGTDNTSNQKGDYIETEVKSSSRFEFLLMFVPIVVLGFFVKVVVDLWAGRYD